MIGPAGRAVIANIEDLRTRRGLSLRELAAKLAQLGRPIGDTVLHRQSQGKRRVDADDLVAFSIALGVNPSALLLPRNVDRSVPVELTAEVTQPAWVAWQWCDGRTPLPAEQVEGDEYSSSRAARVDFATYARPDFVLDDHPALRELDALYWRTLLMLAGEETAERVRNQRDRVDLEYKELLGD